MSGVHCDKCRVRLHNGGSTRKIADRKGYGLHDFIRSYRFPYRYNFSPRRKNFIKMERLII